MIFYDKINIIYFTHKRLLILEMLFYIDYYLEYEAR